eukprot:Blabericola_migrator_1__10671@NODE_608_length_7306_cov_258_002348_g441_i0_p6_GENE_NODE_608_length_7306_cov_258_002348_g441_i0NODE_608_length_7306_cov_258_002348_g441_i0_p6_ORF_typecomplete_len152_score30_89cwf21/PF08312_12/9e11cwf21/PF08312_12/1_1e04_NODE_608_length_7306_cov_258_002348_g441_i020552510
MYNGIGLPTPRGSGTSGYIQRNLGHVPSGAKRKFKKNEQVESTGSVKVKPGGDPELLEHERRRRVEIEVMTYITELEARGVTGDELDELVDKKREELLAEKATERDLLLRESKVAIKRDTHIRAKEKSAEEEKMRRALKIDKSSSRRVFSK